VVGVLRLATTPILQKNDLFDMGFFFSLVKSGHRPLNGWQTEKVEHGPVFFEQNPARLTAGQGETRAPLAEPFSVQQEWAIAGAPLAQASAHRWRRLFWQLARFHNNPLCWPMFTEVAGQGKNEGDIRTALNLCGWERGENGWGLRSPAPGLAHREPHRAVPLAREQDPAGRGGRRYVGMVLYRPRESRPDT